MTLRECYDALEGDYEDVMGRLRTEKLVQKFVLKFPGDGSYDLLTRSMEAGEYEEAFRAAHTLKGVGQNLGFNKLYGSSHLLTEALRGNDIEAAKPLYEQVRADYAQTVNAIRAYQASL